jgi:hypothetical protein
MRSITVVTCDWVSYNAVIKSIAAIPDPAQRRAAAIAQGIPARVSLMSNFSSSVFNLLATASGIEQAGTLYNVLTHSSWTAVGPSRTAELVSLTGAPLPAAAMPPPSWPLTRAPILRVQVVRTMLSADEPFRLRAIVVTPISASPSNVTAYWRVSGSASWTAAPLTQAPAEADVVRFVYTASLSNPGVDFEYYVEATIPTYGGGVFPDSIGLPAGTVVGPNTITCSAPPGGAAAPTTVVIVPQ